ncbi:glycosyl transferase WbpY [Pusillimonas sp. T7-7]|uniref:glycosyltransferase family 4 protein n=1 Tax=Pusillimonas sp. (strain T7-7) TaxID=1007105 RepID=UPI0002084BAE|nr:glycosyltransferase family 1 protein [Pusillimonas sp. T7-7]AEC21707.1 glycosyl transferase WbpY [Pusillimonas sp. T7-7]
MKLILSIETVRYPLTGIGRYVYELASRAMEHREAFESLQLFGLKGFVNELPQAQNTAGSLHHWKGLIQKSHWATEAYRQLSNAMRARALRGYQDHIFHGPSFTLPRFDGKKIATVHDLSPFIWADSMTSQRAKYLQTEIAYTVEHADLLITDSEFTRHEVASYFGWDINKIYAVPLAAAPEFRQRPVQELVKPLARLGLAPGKYGLYVGTIEPRKNIASLLQAYRLLPDALRQEYPLVLTGYSGWKSDDLHQQMQQAEQEGWARYLGYSALEDLPFLYAGARVFAFPSLYEGFGLPVLEAMSSGVPVVCSNRASLPEVVGDAALLNDALDVETLSAHLLQGLTDEDWRALAIQRGSEKSASYSWQKCAEETRVVYRRLDQNG